MYPNNASTSDFIFNYTAGKQTTRVVVVVGKTQEKSGN